MVIQQIYSKRFNSNQNYAQPIIYEWEDIILKELNVPVVRYPFIYKIANHAHMHSSVLSPVKNTFRYVLNGRDQDEPMNSKRVIPCIIDFFEKEGQLKDFYSRHSRNRIVLVSSPFDYQYLKAHNCPIDIGLFPYSLSDKYATDSLNIEKKYDIVLTGRQDPLLYSFFMEYIKRHPGVTYVKRGKELENDDHKIKGYYLNGKDFIGEINTREEFMRLQAQGRVTMYGVQGYDANTKDFYHMTPHFLEIIACRCHILAHYPTDERGVDSRFYEFDKFSPSIETYEEFENKMDNALNSKVDDAMYSSYLKQHYTSVRARALGDLLRGL